MEKNFSTSDKLIQIYDKWASRDAFFEQPYKELIIKLSDYKYGSNKHSNAKGKVIGAGYEVLILAYFIGLYSNKKMPLDQYTDQTKTGQQIQFWGNVKEANGRKGYAHLRRYIFMSLVVRTPEIDWIALEKGKLTINECVNLLINTMEEYINYGLFVISEKMKEYPDYFFDDSSFLDLFKELTKEQDNDFSDIPDSLE